jgi:hypothetical protein
MKGNHNSQESHITRQTISNQMAFVHICITCRISYVHQVQNPWRRELNKRREQPNINITRTTITSHINLWPNFRITQWTLPNETRWSLTKCTGWCKLEGHLLTLDTSAETELTWLLKRVLQVAVACHLWAGGGGAAAASPAKVTAVLY